MLQVSWPLELIANAEAVKKYNQVNIFTFGCPRCLCPGALWSFHVWCRWWASCWKSSMQNLFLIKLGGGCGRLVICLLLLVYKKKFSPLFPPMLFCSHYFFCLNEAYIRDGHVQVSITGINLDNIFKIACLRFLIYMMFQLPCRVEVLQKATASATG